MGRPYYKTSQLTHITYNIFDCVVIMNPSQAAFYVNAGLQLLDLEIGEDRKTKEPVFCYLFDRQDSKPYFDDWCKRKRNN